MNPTWLRHEAIRDPIPPDVRYYSSTSMVTKKENKAFLAFYIHHGGTHMKSLKMALIAFALMGVFGTHAYARDHAINALYIGTVDNDTTGYTVGYNEWDRERYARDRYRHEYRSNRVCREFVEVVRGRHGRYHEVVRTICRDRDDWRRPHHRGHYPRDRYRDNDRW